MIIEIKNTVTGKYIGELKKKLSHPNREIHFVKANNRFFLTISGERNSFEMDIFKDDPNILMTTDPNTQAFFCRKEFSPDKSTVFKVGDIPIGGDNIIIIAGPCAVENYEHLYETAIRLKESGAHIFRAGAYKPRTSPYNFQGMGRKGLELLRQLRNEVKIPIVSEILDPFDIELGDEILDMIQVGTRNMTNQALLKHLGVAKKPILLKRGFSSRLEDLIKAAEFIFVSGNPNIALCERGIQTFETETRYTFDISAIPVLQQMTHLPVVADPSHATGRKDLIPIITKTAILAGADVIMLETHIDPDKMLKPGDNKQTLSIEEFKELISSLKPLLNYIGRNIYQA